VSCRYPSLVRATPRIRPDMIFGKDRCWDREFRDGIYERRDQGGVLAIALAALAKQVVADTQLNCSTKKVVIISAPGGETSSTRQEDLSFRVDDAAKTLRFAGDGPLAVTQFGNYWISANNDGIF
jgi:hypothetical protein